MSILTNNNDELTYTAGNNTYRFYKDEQDDEDEETNDKYTECIPLIIPPIKFL